MQAHQNIPDASSAASTSSCVSFISCAFAAAEITCASNTRSVSQPSECRASNASINVCQNARAVFQCLCHIQLPITIPNNVIDMRFIFACFIATRIGCSEIYMELKKEDPNRIEIPLRKILYKTHEKYMENYINILRCIPGNIPLEIKRSITSYI